MCNCPHLWVQYRQLVFRIVVLFLIIFVLCKITTRCSKNQKLLCSTENFLCWVHHGIDAIMEDMWRVRRDWSDSVPEGSTIEELRNDLNAIIQFNGNKLGQLIMLFYK